MNYNQQNFNHRGQNPYGNRNPMQQGRKENVALQMTQETFEPTIIGEGAKIKGTLEVAGDLIVQGEVIGDIQCQNKVSVTGVIDGNIVTHDIELDHAVVSGDIQCSGDMQLSETATINGDCEAYNMVCGGRIKGNVNTAESLTLEERAAIVGDISAQDIEIHKGAVVQGNINIRQEVYFETDK